VQGLGAREEHADISNTVKIKVNLVMWDMMQGTCHAVGRAYWRPGRLG
jgi:hypothetical protein